jgi:hypothetical protein
MADQDMIDQLAAAAEHPGDPLSLGNPWAQVPHPLAIAPIGAGKARGADLGAWWALEQLGGGRVQAVVEISGHHHCHGPAVVVRELFQL